MTRLTALTAALVALLTLVTPRPSDAQAPTGDREIEALFKAITFLEEKPFDAKAAAVRAAAMKWIIDTDKVSVTVCENFFAGAARRYAYTNDILSQYTIGMAAYKLSKPILAVDESGAQLAGVESALTSYKAMVKEQPNAKAPFMDELLAKQTGSELAEFVRRNNCVKLNTA
jgi:hypothetical protein